MGCINYTKAKNTRVNIVIIAYNFSDNCVSPVPGCGGMISMEIGGNRTAETYTLTSPGYPEGYDINLNCEWIFETAPNNHLSIYFQNMDLEVTYGCYYDFVSIYSGALHTSMILSVYVF